MSRRKITDGLHQRADGRWELKEKINGKMRWFSAVNPADVWEKRDAAITAGEREKAEEDAGPTFNEVADVFEASVRNMKHGTPAIRRAKQRFGDRQIRMK